MWLATSGLLIIARDLFDCWFRQYKTYGGIFWSSVAAVARCSTPEPIEPGTRCQYLDTPLELCRDRPSAAKPGDGAASSRGAGDPLARAECSTARSGLCTDLS